MNPYQKTAISKTILPVSVQMSSAFKQRISLRNSPRFFSSGVIPRIFPRIVEKYLENPPWISHYCLVEESTAVSIEFF